MLVLSRKENEVVEIAGGWVRIVVCDIRGDKVRLGFEADKSVEIHRGEVAIKIREEGKKRD
ncbi:MAG: carbon storage regulator [Planctomycetota bacterium]